jgi:hypothetical protein
MSVFCAKVAEVSSLRSRCSAARGLLLRLRRPHRVPLRLSRTHDSEQPFSLFSPSPTPVRIYPSGSSHPREPGACRPLESNSKTWKLENRRTVAAIAHICGSVVIRQINFLLYQSSKCKFSAELTLNSQSVKRKLIFSVVIFLGPFVISATCHRLGTLFVL